MRIKNLPTHGKQSFSVNYLYEKERVSIEKGDGLIIPIHKNFDNNSRDAWINNTKQNCNKRHQLNKSNQKKLDWNKNTMQLVVSLNPEDNSKMENAWQEVLKEITEKLEIDPIRNNLAAWVHKDKNHHHLHILFSKIDDKGDKWNDSLIGRRLNTLALDMVSKYELTYEEKNKGNKKRTVEPLKDELNKLLFETVKESDNYNQYLDNLEKKGVRVNYDSETNSLTYHYIKDGVLNSFHQSTLQNRFTYENVVRMGEKKEFEHTFVQQKDFIQRAVSRVLNKGVTSYNELETALLKDYNVTVLYNKSKNGKISGISFISNQEKKPFKIKGSQIKFSKSRIEYFMKQNLTKEVSHSIGQKTGPTKKEVAIPYHPTIIPLAQVRRSSRTGDDVESDEERRRLKRLAKEKGRDI